MKKKSNEIVWKTETRQLVDLKEHPKNPRDFTAKGMSDLEASLKKLGYIDLIAINKDGTILGGHARRRQLVKQGMLTCEVRVPNRQLTNEEAEEALIRLNKNIAGSWNMEKLGEFKQEALVEWGFEKSEFNKFPSAEGAKGMTDKAGFFVLLEFENEKEQEKFYNEMTNRGMKCKLMS